MSQLYCPDCGGPYQSGDQVCPECDFPLRMEVIAQGSVITIKGSEAAKWKRLAPLLKRNGLNIVTRPGSGWAGHQAWWALPTLGAMIFITSIIFGGSLVDMIWEPPAPVAAPVLDLNNPDGIAEQAGQREDDPTDQEDVDYLAEAFSPSEEQRQMTNDQNLDLTEYVDRVTVSESRIREFMEQAWLNIVVDNQRGVGTYLGSGGFFLMESSLSASAFRREIRNVSSKGTLTEQAIWIVPMVAFHGDAATESKRKVKADHMSIHLMEADLPAAARFEAEYERELGPNETVWVARYLDGVFYTQKAEVVDSRNISDEARVWVLNSDLDRSESGSPVFDETGKLTGIFLYHDGANTVLSLRTVRERAPLIFKEIQ
ncbi:MAG: hypothetical protein QNK37_23995 [Acidobacteriota bacterium]|nr:hypothetical protein [Acidobacteriota bacterium]